MAPKRASAAPPGNGAGGDPAQQGEAAPPEESPPPPVDEELVMLQKRADAGSAELDKLKQMLQTLMSAQSQNVREAKIIELLRKNATMAKSLDRERLLVGRLRKDFAYLQKELAELKEEEQRRPPESPTTSAIEKAAQESNFYRDKYNQATAKLMEVQGAKAVASVELSRLQHALQREVGNVPIAKVLEEGQFWKGRAQMITLLKDRVAELEQKVRERSLEDHERIFDAKENACKRQIDELAQNFLATKDELIVTKKKVDCIIARRHILEKEMNNVKEKMSVLVAKSDSDDKLIGALRQECIASKNAVAPERQKERISCPIRAGSLHREHQLAASFNDLKLHCQEQELQIKAQAELVDYLRDITASIRGEEQPKEP